MRRSISLLLCVLFLIGNMVPSAMAQGTENINIKLNGDDIEIISKSIAFAYKDPDSNLVNIMDLNSIEIGGIIPVFDYMMDGIIESKTLAYPIYSDGFLCAIAFVANGVAQIDLQIANELLKSNLESNTIALMYDAVSLYVYDGHSYKLLHDYEKIDGRAYLKNDDLLISKGDVLSGEENLLPLADLDILSDASIDGTTSSAVYLSVGFQYQPAGCVYCWACADACIGNKITGKSVSGYTLAKYFYPNNPNTSATIRTAINHMNEYYSSMTYPYVVYNDIPSIDQIKYFLDYGHPIYGEFSYTGNFSKRHATVIRGADTYNGYISLMDPDISDYYRSASMAWVGDDLTFVFTNSENDDEWMLTNSAYPNYWA